MELIELRSFDLDRLEFLQYIDVDDSLPNPDRFPKRGEQNIFLFNKTMPTFNK